MAYTANNPVINWRMLLKVTGWLLMIEALFMLVPTAVGFAYGDADRWTFAGTAAGTAVAGIAMQCIRARDSRMTRRDGFLLTASVWVWFSIAGMMPFVFGHPQFSISDAFFEAMSGFTTTGASIMDSHAHLTPSINLWRALMQWIGGMGIILFTLAVLPMLNSSGGMQMFNAEVTGITHDKVRPRVSSTAKALWGTYIALTIALVACLWLGPMDAYDSFCYAFSSMSTGGFTPSGDSLARFDSTYVYAVLTVFMFLGGVSFLLLFQAAHGRIRQLLRNDVLQLYFGAVILAWAVFAVTVGLKHGWHLPWQEYTVYPVFQVVSTITSTGLDTGRFDTWTPLVIALMMVMMFTGACAGSTSGGAKLDRMLLLYRHLKNEVARCVRPNAIFSVRVNGRITSPQLVDKVVGFMCLYVILICIGGVALCAMGIPLVDAWFSSFACVSNTGFSASLTGYGTTYAIMPDTAKWLLSLLMLTGRLEIFTVLILFTRPFWRK